MANRVRHWLWNILCVLSLAACAVTVVAWQSNRLQGFGFSSGHKEYRVFTFQAQLRLHVLELVVPRPVDDDQNLVRSVRRVAAVPCWLVAVITAVLPGWRCWRYLRQAEWARRVQRACRGWIGHDLLRGFGIFCVIIAPWAAFVSGLGGAMVSLVCGCVLVGGSVALEALARATREQRGFEVIVGPPETKPASTNGSDKGMLEQSAGRK